MADKNVDQVKAALLADFLGEMQKERPGEVLRMSDEGAHGHIQVIPTGAISLDVALGAGGFPKGRIVELFGPEMSGKTSLALSVAANAQAAGGNVGFVDAEHALSRKHASDFGLDFDRLVEFQPDSGEQAIEMVEKMVKSGSFDVVIVDSVAAMVPKAEIDADVEQQHMGLHARLMSKFMRRIAGVVAEHNVCLILVNQIRADLGAYGTPMTTPGGKAIKFYSSVRVEVRSAASKKITVGKNVIGQTCVVTVKKNKVGAPHKVAEYDLIFGKGIDSEGSVVEAAEATGVLTRAGASYTVVATGERLAVGKANAKERLRNEPELTEELVAAVYEALAHSTQVSASEQDAEDFGGSEGGFEGDFEGGFEGDFEEDAA
ncbi:MAG: recombinase RecA [Actinomycetia bacterium]|nr:recombinase RecA [Actinomycetes bacterium]